ncbi:MAG TPA: hypothetical protein VEC93_01540, partial [Anaerolineae bacterium]|nr:hypothetical protein [Anaerolineae bacterium]
GSLPLITLHDNPVVHETPLAVPIAWQSLPLSISTPALAKAFELVKAGELIWTGEHGVPGKAGLFQTNPILRCDPQADFEIEIGPFKPEE